MGGGETESTQCINGKCKNSITLTDKRYGNVS